MEVVRLFDPVFRWLVVLAEAGGLLWLLSLFLASLAWVAWGVATLVVHLRWAAKRLRPFARDPVPAPVRAGAHIRGPARR